MDNISKEILDAVFETAEKRFDGEVIDNLTKRLFFVNIPNAKEYIKHGLSRYVGENYQWLDEYDEVCDWLEDNKGQSLIIFGNCGVGKSVLTSIISLLIAYKMNKLFRPVTAQDFAKLDAVSRERPLWLIDDLGTERKVKEYGTEKDNITTLLNILESRGNCAIITTNLNGQQIIERYGDRNADRIKHLFRQVHINHASMRENISQRRAGDGGIYQSRI